MMSELPDPIADLDQALRGQEDWAKVVARYYFALQDEGLTSEHALAVTVGWQAVQLAKVDEA